MMNTHASAYDQNPARMALIVKTNHKKENNTTSTTAFSVLFGLAVIVACIWRVVPL